MLNLLRLNIQESALKYIYQILRAQHSWEGHDSRGGGQCLGEADMLKEKKTSLMILD